MSRGLPERPVVLITGGSSGVGRATALAFGARRARLVLAARDADALEETAAECRNAGGEVLVQRVEMSDDAATEMLRASAADAFGRIDVWINCAALLLFGRFEEVPPDAFRRVIEANVMGYANGARAALKQFRMQDDRGVLINVGSMLGVVPEPYVSAYVASKFAIRGLGASLRQELRDAPEIHVCTLLPAALDTPIYQKAGNHSGKAPRAIFPAYPPERAAQAILRLAARPRPEARVGGFAHLLAAGARTSPKVLERLIGRAARRLQFRDVPVATTSGNLFDGIGPHTSTGGWQRYWRDLLRLRR